MFYKYKDKLKFSDLKNTALILNFLIRSIRHKDIKSSNPVVEKIITENTFRFSEKRTFSLSSIMYDTRHFLCSEPEHDKNTWFSCVLHVKIRLIIN